MKHFMIWTVLVPAIAFCQDDLSQPSAAYDVANEAEKVPKHPAWDTSDCDNFLQQPPPPLTLEVDGTITKENDEYDTYGVSPWGDDP